MITDKLSPTRVVVCAVLSLMILLMSLAAFPYTLSSSEMDRRLDILEKDSYAIHSEHSEIMSQIATLTKALSDLTDIVYKHHEAQAGYPAFLATMDTKLSWVLVAMGLFMTSGAAYAWNRIRYADRVADELRRHAQAVLQLQNRQHGIEDTKHHAVMDELQLSRTDAHNAYEEANSVNRKLATLEQGVRDNQPT